MSNLDQEKITADLRAALEGFLDTERFYAMQKAKLTPKVEVRTLTPREVFEMSFPSGERKEGE
jgi:hypothetical protein